MILCMEIILGKIKYFGVVVVNLKYFFKIKKTIFNFFFYKLYYIILLLDVCVYFRYKVGKGVFYCNFFI